ncbi:MAG: ATP-binding protein [Phycisphaerales bacterium]|nr:ATP-binding protein [Phycisphaerales bacterium]
MSASDLSDICKVISVSQNLIQIEILDPAELKKQPEQRLTIGTYLKIADDDGLAVIAIVQAYRIKDPASSDAQAEPSTPSFVMDAYPLGYLDKDGKFQRGGQQIAIPPTHVSIADSDTLAALYSSTKPEGALSIGTLAHDQSVEVPIDGDVFFGKHIAVVGSTGSGKSCAVAKIVQEGRRQSDDQETRAVLNNAHVIVFDLHGEYATAFPGARVLDVKTLKVPYWLMTAEELEEIFIESREESSHNQVSQFRHAVQANKRKHNSCIHVSYDSAVYFSIEEVYNYICNMNAEVIGRTEGEGVPKLADGTLVSKREDVYFHKQHAFVVQSTSKNEKATKGPFMGDFDRFVLRLRTTLDSERLAFLFKPEKAAGKPYKTEDMKELIEGIVGYGEKKGNITIIDLHGVPFEVHSLVVSLLSRIIFQVGFYRKRKPKETEVAFLIVYEEAHNYVPNSPLARFRSVTRSIERIAKEGRKYGVSLMIVSQRPSEISETVFSQCNSFVVMRLTNPTDQNYVRRLLPDAIGGLTEALPTLAQREALVLGECIQVPTLLRVAEITDTPHSHDIAVLQEWRKDWADLPFGSVLDGMKRH